MGWVGCGQPQVVMGDRLNCWVGLLGLDCGDEVTLVDCATKVGPVGQTEGFR